MKKRAAAAESGPALPQAAPGERLRPHVPAGAARQQPRPAVTAAPAAIDRQIQVSLTGCALTVSMASLYQDTGSFASLADCLVI